MKIAHAVYYYLAVTENWIHDQIVGLSPYHDQIVLAGLTENIDIFPVDKLISFEEVSPMNKFRQRVMRKLYPDYVLPFWREHIKHADLVHSHFGDEGYRNYDICRRFGVKHITSFYGYDLTEYMASLVWRTRFAALFEDVDKVIVEGGFARQTIINAGCDPNKVIVNHLGVKIENIPHRIRKVPVSAPLRVLMAAGFNEKKGLVYGIRALGKLVEQRREVLLTVIGDSRSKRSKVKKEIMQALVDTGLMSRTRLLGFVPYETLLEEAMKHDIFLSPSITTDKGTGEGGAPVSLLHVQATGLPVVSTLHCDIPEYVVNGVTGILVEEKNVDLLAMAMLAVEGNLERFSMHCRGHVANNYDSQKMIRNLNEIYKRLG